MLLLYIIDLCRSISQSTSTIINIIRLHIRKIKSICKTRCSIFADISGQNQYHKFHSALQYDTFESNRFYQIDCA